MLIRHAEEGSACTGREPPVATPLRRLAGSLKVPRELSTPDTRSSRSGPRIGTRVCPPGAGYVKLFLPRMLHNEHAYETLIDPLMISANESCLRASHSRIHGTTDHLLAGKQPCNKSSNHASCGEPGGLDERRDRRVAGDGGERVPSIDSCATSRERGSRREGLLAMNRNVRNKRLSAGPGEAAGHDLPAPSYQARSRRVSNNRMEATGETAVRFSGAAIIALR